MDPDMEGDMEGDMDGEPGEDKGEGEDEGASPSKDGDSPDKEDGESPDKTSRDGEHDEDQDGSKSPKNNMLSIASENKQNFTPILDDDQLNIELHIERSVDPLSDVQKLYMIAEHAE